MSSEEMMEDMLEKSLDMIAVERKSEGFRNRRMDYVARKKSAQAPFKSSRNVSVRKPPMFDAKAYNEGKCTVYVENLHKCVDLGELIRVMGKAGKVIRAEIPTGERGLSKGFGIVEFSTPREARICVDSLDGFPMVSKPIKITFRNQYVSRNQKVPFREPNERAKMEVLHPENAVFVGNLPFKLEEGGLRKHMELAGDVRNLSVYRGFDGRSKGIGLVEYFDYSEAKKAIMMLNETEIDGRKIFVSKNKALQEKPPQTTFEREALSPNEVASTKVYVGNVSWDVSWKELKDHMKKVPGCIHVDIFTDQLGRSKGCAIVEYASRRDAANAIKTLNNTNLNGRNIFVRRDKEEERSMQENGVGNHNSGTAPPNNNAQQVKVLNLDERVTWMEIKDYFKAAGNVLFVSIEKGFNDEVCAKVRFASTIAASKAVASLNNTILGRNRIRVCRIP